MLTFHHRMTTLVSEAAKQQQNLLVQVKETANGVLTTESGSVLLLYSALGYASESEMMQAAKKSGFKLTNSDNFEHFGVKFEKYGSGNSRPFLLLAGSGVKNSQRLSVKDQLDDIKGLRKNNLGDSKGKFRHFVFS